MEAKIEKEMRRAEKVRKKQLMADVEAIEHDAVSVTSWRFCTGAAEYCEYTVRQLAALRQGKVGAKIVYQRLYRW